MELTDQRIDRCDPLDGNEVALTFIGCFGGLQWSIDYFVAEYLTAKLPFLGPVLVARAVERPSDPDRVEFVTAMAKDIDYSGDLTRFQQTYNRARDARNLMSHGDVAWPVVPMGGGEPSISVSKSSRKRGTMRFDTEYFTPAEVIALARDCSWLEDHVMRIVFETRVINVQVMAVGGVKPFHPPVPPAFPPHRRH